MKFTLRVLLPTLLLCSLNNYVFAWDSSGHRISAAVVLQLIDADTRDNLLSILQAHPRYREDFLNEIPRFVDQNNQMELAQWLLGQAAYWPDIARGLPDQDRRRYNRPGWHYTDGAWVRGAAQLQGNVYLDMEPFADIQGLARTAISNENQVSNVVTAIDFNVRVLTDSSRPESERAVALCWVLHLMGDIHQPLHAGSLFSEQLFASGDRGGNAIPLVGDSNLHSRWDRALAEGGVVNELPRVMATLEQHSTESVEPDWTVWLAESRQLLDSVYTPQILDAIRSAQNANGTLQALDLSSDYTLAMRTIARQRLGLAGLRLANFFSSQLSN